MISHHALEVIVALPGATTLCSRDQQGHETLMLPLFLSIQPGINVAAELQILCCCLLLLSHHSVGNIILTAILHPPQREARQTRGCERFPEVYLTQEM